VQPKSPSRPILLAFFALGAASDLSWNAMYMRSRLRVAAAKPRRTRGSHPSGAACSVAYFEGILGQHVVAHLGLAQNLPWLGVMAGVYA
jgi:hypothetical protein